MTVRVSLHKSSRPSADPSRSSLGANVVESRSASSGPVSRNAIKATTMIAPKYFGRFGMSTIAATATASRPTNAPREKVRRIV